MSTSPTDRDATLAAAPATLTSFDLEGTAMFDEPGIGPDDFAWIDRDQYVYYVAMAHHLGDPTDWAAFRSDLAEALAAAFGLNRTPPWADQRSAEDLRTRQRTLDVLDAIRFRHNPATDWDVFFDALWEKRSTIRGDPDPS